MPAKIIPVKIDTVTLYVSDQRKARDFYVGELGFEVRKDADMGPMGRWFEVAPAGVPVTDPENQAWAVSSKSPIRTGWNSWSASPGE